MSYQYTALQECKSARGRSAYILVALTSIVHLWAHGEMSHHCSCSKPM